MVTNELRVTRCGSSGASAGGSSAYCKRRLTIWRPSYYTWQLQGRSLRSHIGTQGARAPSLEAYTVTQNSVKMHQNTLFYTKKSENCLGFS